ncbi:hypothetical protein JYB88_05895 [Shewanella cyperi]|uniref:Lipoprotein n=1 Tax=Shewanella cyperi TaxID=2814292 RepID=A0A975ALU9_9GAMM|nr:hypothetical protein [Shewanella cyperi]QSX31171.1 hypothetical protein JYB88_05895 [Shewanella cyperi]
MNYRRFAVSALVLCLLPLSRGWANDSINSELSHFAGGAAMALGTMVIADHYGQNEHRAWLGFGVATGIGILGEVADKAKGHEVSWLDIAVNSLGAAVGAYGGERWLLTPVIKPEERFAGVTLNYLF